MKKDLANRPQKLGDALEGYMNDVKINRESLNTRYTGGELVDIIKLEINPETHAKCFYGESYNIPGLAIKCNNLCKSRITISQHPFCKQLILTMTKTTPCLGC